MQHLLDFIHEHTIDEQVYLVAPTSAASLELMWKRRSDPEHWQVRAYRADGPWQSVPKAELLALLERRGADMAAVERELNAMAVTQIVFADMVLCDARKRLGRDKVREAVLGHRDFVKELRAALTKIQNEKERGPEPPPVRESMRVLAGSGEGCGERKGRLSLVPISL